MPGGWLGGFTSDWLYARGWSLPAARKTRLIGGMLLSSSITLAVVMPAACMALAVFALSYAALAFTAAGIWSLPGDVAPTRAQVGLIGGIQNLASNLAGVVTTSFTGVMLTITGGSFAIPLVAAGVRAVRGGRAGLPVRGRPHRAAAPAGGRVRSNAWHGSPARSDTARGIARHSRGALLARSAAPMATKPSGVRRDEGSGWRAATPRPLTGG